MYLFRAEAALVTGVRADIEREPLHAALALSLRQPIVLAPSVGYSADPSRESGAPP